MDFRVKILLLLSVLVFGLAVGNPSQADKSGKPPADLEQIAENAYVFGYPLVLMEVTRKFMTNVPKPTEKYAPLNHFVHFQIFPGPEGKEVVRPNLDTLYSLAFLDLSQEPIILHLPDISRYYVMQMIDAWTNVFAAPGTRTLGEKGGDFAVVGPKWKGNLPAQVQKIQAPTDNVWMVGRILTRGKADCAAVHPIQSQITLTPLSAWGKKSSPPAAGPVDAKVDMKTPPMHQLLQMQAGEFFPTMARVMKTNPPAPADAPAVKEFAAVGLIPGKDLNLDKLDPAVVKALEAGVGRGQKRIFDQAFKAGESKNGWQVMRDPIGAYGTNYDVRAAVALFGLGANLLVDGFYPIAVGDQEGKPFTGQHRYVLHFDKDQLPPVNAFWSLTMYDKEGFLVPNPLGRQALGDRDPLTCNTNGALDLYLQNQSPGPDKEANWLPAPAGGFNVTLRLYWPKKEVVAGSWNPPPIKRVE